MTIYTVKNCYLHSRLLWWSSRPAHPLVSLLAVGSRCRGFQPTAFYPQTASSLDGFNVRGGADVREKGYKEGVNVIKRVESVLENIVYCVNNNFLLCK